MWTRDNRLVIILNTDDNMKIYLESHGREYTRSGMVIDMEMSVDGASFEFFEV